MTEKQIDEIVRKALEDAKPAMEASVKSMLAEADSHSFNELLPQFYVEAVRASALVISESLKELLRERP